MSNRVAANLVIGADGSTTRGGSSRGLSFEADRQRFHQLRGEFDVILVGGNTARSEPYSKTPIPLIVLTHGALPQRLGAGLGASFGSGAAAGQRDLWGCTYRGRAQFAPTRVRTGVDL
jgi:hypothetical protein